MTRTEYLQGLSKVLFQDLHADDQPVSPHTWDSIEILETIELIDRAGTTVQIGDIMGCETVGDLVRLAGNGVAVEA